MGKTKSGNTKGEPHPVSLRLVILAVSQDEAKKSMLEEGCFQATGTSKM